MKFDWQRFCTEHQIHFVTSGPNTGRGRISVKCPWCGESDPSEHMGLSVAIENPVWGCLRNPEHRGANPRRLVQRLLRCSFNQAVSIVEAQNRIVPDDFDTFLLSQKPRQEAAKVTFEIPRPKEFRDFEKLSKYTMRFLEYVGEDKGFGKDAITVCKTYELYYALTGDFAWRIIVPVYDLDKKVRNWVGRAIHPDASLRYRTNAASRKDL